MLNAIAVVALLTGPLSSTGPSQDDGPVVNVWTIAPLAGGSRAALGCADASIRIVDTATGELVRTLSCPDGPPDELLAAPSGGRIAVGTQGREGPKGSRTKVWRWSVVDVGAPDQAAFTRLGEKLGWSSYARFDREGGRVVVWSEESAATVHDAASGKKLFDLGDDDERILAVCWAEATDQIVTGGAKGSIRTWQADTGKPGAARKGATRTECVEVSPDGRSVFCGSEYVRGAIWSLPELEFGSQFRASGSWLMAPDDRIARAAWAPDGSRLHFTTMPWHTLECRSSDGKLFWQADSNGGREEALDVAMEPGGRRVAVPRWNERTVFDARTGENLGSGIGVAYPRAVTWTTDGTRLLLLHKFRIRILSAETLTLERELAVTRDGVRLHDD